MEAARAAAISFVDGMRSQDMTGVIAFDTQMDIVQPLTSDKDALRQAIASIQPRGDTAMYDALAASINMLSGVQGRRAIIMLSDGIDNASQQSSGAVLNSSQSAELTIYSIGLGDPSQGAFSKGGSDENALRAISDGSHGSYSYTPDPQSLSQLYQQLSHELQNEYHLTYVTNNSLRDGVERNIAVQVAGAGGVQAI
jgi:VWFA-related protein